jgi:protein phosphatase PTC7
LKLTKNIGTSTCCLLAIDPKDPLLRTANIGDSGYLLYRKEGERLKCYYESPEHQRSFNFPYQIGTNGDNPEISIEKTHELINSGDLVILGTDG